MKHYAIINEQNICTGYAEAPKEIVADNYIEIPSPPAPIGKKYDNGEWKEYEPIPEPEPPLTEQEQIAIDTALNVEYIACLMEASLG